MGVPNFLSYLTKHYPDVCSYDFPNRLYLADDLDGPEVPKKVDNLYLDLNTIIHQALYTSNQSVRHGPLNPIGSENTIHPFGAGDRIILINRISYFIPTKNCTKNTVKAELYQKLDFILSKFRPTKLAYFAIDGPAPFAKLRSQRKRRFMQVSESRLTASSDHELNSNAVSPGTEFMTSVNRWIHEYVQKRVPLFNQSTQLVSIVSDSSVIGEGEHKIAEFIRQQSKFPLYSQKQSHFIITSDSDMIILLLSCNLNWAFVCFETPNPSTPTSTSSISPTNQSQKNIICLKNSIISVPMKISPNLGQVPCGINTCSANSKSGEASAKRRITKKNLLPSVNNSRLTTIQSHIILDLSLLKNQLYNKVIQFQKHEHSTPKKQYKFQRVVDDLVLLITFLGNDYLPRLPYQGHIHDALDYLIQTYAETMEENGYLCEKSNIEWNNLALYLARMLSKKESGYSINQHIKTCNPIASESIPKSFKNDSSTTYPGKSNTYSENCILSKKFQFYNNLYPEFRTFSIKEKLEKIQSAIQNYLAGLSWCLSCIHDRVHNWDWYYIYNQSPLATDITQYLVDATSQDDNGAPFLSAIISKHFNAKIQKPLLPLQQLLAILPPKSYHLLPAAYSTQLTKDAAVSSNAFARLHSDNALYPIIKEDLLKFSQILEDQLSDDERSRNKFGDPTIYLSIENRHYNDLNNLVCDSITSTTPTETYFVIRSVPALLPLSNKNIQTPSNEYCISVKHAKIFLKKLLFD
ncbi:uncharacterized protein LOC126325881 [Schistocerca gregaria]|uniref:uncharacterized protein LOC126325881 n=1 Tax=Schistocerca gregaria TaxID=7010 RepID=UPI00211E029F|nr:uncharacterized protein LOC126325881 [Schistocerca gregaria]